ncbi:MAG TPA: ABC transporter ATP-binding protein [Candidatus Acidoferrum sp.]|nr:ABC transporter ATP-binding protein [Candidatus Acidoferrum sp.]
MSAIAQPVSATAPKAERRLSGVDHLKTLIPYILKYRGMICLGLLALLLTGLVGTLPQLILGALIDCVKGEPRALSTLTGLSREVLEPVFHYYSPKSVHTVGVFCLILVLIMLVKGFLSYWTRWILIGMSREIEYDIRNDLLAKLVELEPEFYVRNRTGDLMSRATNDLNAVRMVLGPGIMYSATTIATMSLAIYFMLKLSPSLTLWVLLPVPIVAVAVRYFGQIIHRLSEQIQAVLGVLSTRAQENLSGIRVVRAYAQEDAQIASFDEANRGYVGKNIQLISAWSLFFPGLSTIIGLTYVILLGKGGTQVMQGHATIGTFWAFYMFLVQLVFPMIALGWVTNIFQRGAASMGRLNFILHAEPSIRDEAPAAPRAHASISGNGDAALATAAPEIRGDIEFRHMTFGYPTVASANGEPVLRDINLHIPAGSSLAVVGPTGSGKSTLASLIARLWEAPPGTLLLDGLSIRAYPLAELRRAIGYVPQDTYLFSETIRENIAFGVPEAREEHVLEAAEIASLSGDIQGFPETFDTMVGERGITLSGGQKQRTALARAVLRQPKILVLDDALSSVDTDTEEKILRRLRDVMRLRTTVIVAHRISTVKDADQIVVLRDGRIIERGTHEQLLVMNGYYADLYQKQLLEEELERE